MTIASIMNPRIATTGPDEGFIDLLKTMRSKPSRLLHVVAKDGKLLGVISNYDLLKVMLPFYMDSNLAKAVAFDEEFARRTLQENKGLTAKDIMVADCVTLTEDAHFLEAEALLKEKGVNALSVVDAAGRAVGEVTRKALQEWFFKLPKISIDFAVMEKADKVHAIQLNCQWLDMGSFAALADVIKSDENGKCARSI